MLMEREQAVTIVIFSEWDRGCFVNNIILINCGFYVCIQLTTSSHRQDGGAYCVAPVGGKYMVSKAKFVLFAFAV